MSSRCFIVLLVLIYLFEFQLPCLTPHCSINYVMLRNLFVIDSKIYIPADQSILHIQLFYLTNWMKKGGWMGNVCDTQSNSVDPEPQKVSEGTITSMEGKNCRILSQPLPFNHRMKRKRLNMWNNNPYHKWDKRGIGRVIPPVTDSFNSSR